MYTLLGDFMKQNVKIVIFSCLIGATLAGIFFLGVKEKAEAKTKPFIYAFQVGVFKSLENAENLKNNYSFAKVIKDQEYYRVFIGVTVNNKDALRRLFESQGYNYYVKEMQVSGELQEKIVKYDEFLIQTSDENINGVLKNMLECLPDEL